MSPFTSDSSNTTTDSHLVSFVCRPNLLFGPLSPLVPLLADHSLVKLMRTQRVMYTQQYPLVTLTHSIYEYSALVKYSIIPRIDKLEIGSDLLSLYTRVYDPANQVYSPRRLMLTVDDNDIDDSGSDAQDSVDAVDPGAREASLLSPLTTMINTHGNTWKIQRLAFYDVTFYNGNKSVFDAFCVSLRGTFHGLQSLSFYRCKWSIRSQEDEIRSMCECLQGHPSLTALCIQDTNLTGATIEYLAALLDSQSMIRRFTVNSVKPFHPSSWGTIVNKLKETR